MDELAALAPSEGLDLGVITTPGWAAQQVADLLVGAGATSLLNFAPRVLVVPPEVHIRYVDLSIELQVLGFYRARHDGAARGTESAAGTEGTPVPLVRAVGLSPGSELDLSSESTPAHPVPAHPFPQLTPSGALGTVRIAANHHQPGRESPRRRVVDRNGVVGRSADWRGPPRHRQNCRRTRRQRCPSSS